MPTLAVPDASDGELTQVNSRLSICIPTFNRCELLRECLEVFVPLAEPYQIPIYVSDNGSTDGTVAMLKQFKQTRYPLLSFRANANNQGIDQNMVDVLAMASSEYGWLFGDDDLPQPGAIETVLKYLNDDVKLVVVNASTHNADFSRQVEERRIRLFEDRIYPAGDHNRLMVDTASYITYLGGLVVDLASWRSVDHRPFLNTDYLHVSVVLRYIVGKRAVLCAEPQIRLRLQRPTWFSRYFEVEMVNWPRTVWGVPDHHYSHATKQSVCDEKPTASLRRIVATRAYGQYDRKAYESFVASDRDIPNWRKQIFKSIASLPSAWFRAAFVAYIQTRRFLQPSRYELALYRLTETVKWRS